MNDPKPRRLLRPIGIAVLVLALFATASAVLVSGYRRQQADVEAVRQRGGTVLLGPSSKVGLPPDVESIDLSSVAVDSELMSQISRLSTNQRLKLDGASLRPEDYALLGAMPQLRNLSLCKTNVADEDLAQFPSGIRELWLTDTSITDKGLSQLTAMQGLDRLDITGTQVTPRGLKALEPLQTLKALSLDDSCVTAESVQSLQRMQLQTVDVTVREGMGRRAYSLLAGWTVPEIRGRHPEGYILWPARSPWDETLAGVVEAVVDEIGLDAQQTAEFLAALGDQSVDWGRERPPALPFARWATWPDTPDSGRQIQSMDEFLRELQTDPYDISTLRRFVRERFSPGDVPSLLAAMRASRYIEARPLFWYGTFLLIQYGMDDPEVVAELDRLLAQEPNACGSTICAFGYGGASPFYSRDEWTPGEKASEFAVPRLLRILRDDDELDQVRDAARIVLMEIACSTPEYTTDVLTALVELLDEDVFWHNLAARPISHDIPRLAKRDPEAAVALVPKIRKILTELDEQLADAPALDPDAIVTPESMRPQRRRLSVLEALSVTAGHDPALAHEVALDYFQRMEAGKPVGPFAPLLSPATPETNRIVVLGLLRDTDANKAELASVAETIRDWRLDREQPQQ